MAAMCDFDRQVVAAVVAASVVQPDPDWDRRPRVCDWDRIDRRGLISPSDLLAVDWFSNR
jgi:hypothetical protein